MQAATVDITTEEIDRLINVTGGDRFLFVISSPVCYEPNHGVPEQLAEVISEVRFPRK